MVALIVSIITCVLIIVSILVYPNIKIKNFNFPTYILVALIGASILLLTKSVSINSIAKAFDYSNAMNPWKILVLFISMTILSIFLDEIGFFKYIANLSLSHFKTNQVKLFIGLYVFLSLLTIFTSNDIIILTFTPFICYYAKNAKIDPLPYLVAEFVASNTWSMVLIVGNPTNIYLASSFNISFLSYFKTMIAPTAAASVISFSILFALFYKKLQKPMTIEITENKEPNMFLTIVGLFHLILCIILIAISNYFNFEMWIVTLSCCVSLNIIYGIYRFTKKEKSHYYSKTLKRAPWSLIPFVLSMFIMVLALKEQGYVKALSDLFGKDNVFVYGYSGAVVANLINNIPMSVFYTEILQGASLKAVYASIISSNIAAFISPFGALAGIMWMNQLKEQNIEFGFGQFLKYGLIIGIPSLSVALLVLYII